MGSRAFGIGASALTPSEVVIKKLKLWNKMTVIKGSKKKGKKGKAISKIGLYKYNDKNYKIKYDKVVEKRKKVEASPGEKLVMSILIKKNINFDREHNAEGLINPRTLYPLFLDFYLPDLKAAIEFDGLHHYARSYGPTALKSQRYRDEIKNKYCRSKGIKLLRIPYYESQIEQSITDFIKRLT